MLILVLLTVGLTIACVLAVRAESLANHAPEDLAAAAAEPAPPRPDSLEGVLAGQLFGGDISPRQYVRSMELVALREEQRNPSMTPWME